MELGSPQHKAQLLQDLTKTYQENIWKEELVILEFENLLGDLRKQLAQADLKLENKEYSSAGEGRKEVSRLKSDIEATSAAIARKQADKTLWTKRLDLLKQYQESA